MTKDIILNEAEWLRGMLDRLELGTKPWYTLGVYARYLGQNGIGKAETRRRLEEYLLRCDPTVNLQGWQDTIDAIMRYAAGKNLVDISGVAITKEELEWIKGAGAEARRKLLFTMVCLAKYYGILNEQNNGWINTEIADLFLLANIRISRKRQGVLINSLMEDGYVSFGKRIDSNNIRVLNPCGISEVALVVTDFRNLGNQYMNYISGGFILCAECGIMVRKTNNRRRYCADCAEKINRINTLEKHRQTAENSAF